MCLTNVYAVFLSTLLLSALFRVLMVVNHPSIDNDLLKFKEKLCFTPSDKNFNTAINKLS